MNSVLVLLLAVWLGSCAVLTFPRRKQLAREWCDPVFRVPILIFESDDWGPGPASDAEALQQIASALSKFADEEDRRPVMTLGVVLGLPDGEWIAAGGFTQYRSIPLTDPRYAAIVAEMRAGAKQGVFALQLHGGEHYWPPALLAKARCDAAIGAWLAHGPWARAESLPPALQTRWADCARLPSETIAESEMRAAVEAETKAFSETFGFSPRVVVPPTFVWTQSVERAWAGHGIAVLVTPGRILTGRDSEGKLIEGGMTWNGQRSASGVAYLVRDAYFEPTRGHRAEEFVRAMIAKMRTGRPVLVETHRDNFTGSAELRARSIGEMQRVIEQCQAKFPGVRFMSTEELAGIAMAKSPKYIEHRILVRALVFLVRVRNNPSLRKYALVTGLALLSRVGELVSRSLSSGPEALRVHPS